jgi:multidrug efflux pump
VNEGVSGPFIRRPVATTLLVLGLLLAGITGFRQLPVAALPQVDYPTIVVTTQLPGASAETMASSVTTPLERQFGQVPSLSQMTSISSFGSSQITLQFALDRDIEAAEQDVQAAINAASNLLPTTLPAPPTYSKSNPADQPILTLSATSETLPLSAVSDYADSVLAQKISQVAGVGLVTTGGGQKPAVRVQVDPVALAGAGLTLEDVRTSIAAANVNQPKGNLDGKRQDWAIATTDQLADAKSFEPLVIAYKNGSPIRLEDVATVVDGVENSQLAGWGSHRAIVEVNGKQQEHRKLDHAVIINVQRQPGANIIDVADAIKKMLPQLEQSMPQAIHVEVLSDRTTTVRASVHEVQFTLVLTIGLVIAVIYLFLGSLRATVIPGVAVPLALIGTFGVMKLAGFSLNNLSLMALTISTGFVVDDAIVMVENITRFVEEGEKPFDAALKGAKQIGPTIISLTLSLNAVLIPLLFMGGLVGRLFKEFALTLSIAIGLSAVLSLTLTAMMSAWILKPHGESQRSVVAEWFEGEFAILTRFYERTLAVVIEHRFTTLLVTIATAAFTAFLAVTVPKGFFPQEDTGAISGVTEAAPDVSFPKMMEQQEEVARIVLGDPDVDSLTAAIGADGTNPASNVGRFSVQLKPSEERGADVHEIIERVQKRLADVPGMKVYLQPVQDLQIDARVSRTQFQYTLEDADPGVLEQWAPKIMAEMQKLPEVRDVASDQQATGLQLHLEVDRDSAGRLGITTAELDNTLYDAFGQRIVSTTFTQLNQYRIILEVRGEDRDSIEALDRLYIRTTNATAVPLSQVAHWETKPAPLAVAHQGQFPSVTLSFNTAPDVSLGDAVAAIKTASDRIGPPPTMRGAFTGAAQAFQDSLSTTPILILAALITVYIVLGVLYESYIHPITILSTLPSAGVGAILALYVTGNSFDVIALIGVILLIGIVQKNAIMMIDFALEIERDEKLSPKEAIAKACALRFRPIMMTTLAALLGGVPLAIGTGTGSELRRPLGITIVGGLLLSQILTLYTTPVIYLYMERIQRFFSKTKKPGEHAPTVDHIVPTPEHPQ